MSLVLSGNNFNQKGIIHTENDISRTIIGSGGTGGYHDGNQPKIIRKDNKNMKVRIRKLTPKECFRLQGAKDEDFERAKAIGISDSQLYKIAGNALIAGKDRTEGCISLIMQHLYKAQYDPDFECYDETFLKAQVE